MKNLNVDSEIIICKKYDKIITKFTKCPISVIVDNLTVHRLDVFKYIMSINKYDEIFSRDCMNIFKLISEEVFTINDMFYCPSPMSICLSTNIVLGEQQEIIYSLIDVINNIKKEYQQFI